MKKHMKKNMKYFNFRASIQSFWPRLGTLIEIMITIRNKWFEQKKFRDRFRDQQNHKPMSI